MTTTVKTCFKCHLTLPISQFYRHAQMAGGYLNKCKECAKHDAATHREQNLAKVQAYDRQRGNLPHRVAARAFYAQTEAGKEALRRSSVTWDRRHPLQAAAKTAVNNALKSGKLVRQPCEAQNCARKAQAHHEDYSKPLDVRWMCPTHHAEHHKAERAAARATA